MRVFMWRGPLSRDFQGNVVGRVGDARSSGSGALLRQLLSRCAYKYRNQESSAKVGVFAVTVDVVGAAGGWLLTPRIVLHRPAAVSVGCCA